MNPDKAIKRKTAAAVDPLEILRSSGAAEIDYRLEQSRKAKESGAAAVTHRRKNYLHQLLQYGTRAAAAVLVIGILSWSTVSGIRFSQNRKALQSEISRFVEEMYSGTSLLQTEAASLQASVIDSAE
ncbi:MAG: hypothetical protein KKC64_16340, partial [Spirochaetes bacterium]|nr:hypothetical protein [Spirochaetota bacterium]